MSPVRQSVLDDLFDAAAAEQMAHIRRGMRLGRHKDPISIVISIATAIEATAAAVGGALGIGAAAGGSIGAAAGAAAGVGGFTLLGGLGGSIGALGLSIGLNYAANAIMRASAKDRGGLAQGINAPEVRLNTRQEIPPRRRVYGSPLVGGALFFEECKPPYFYRGFLLSDGPVDGPEQFFNSTQQINVNLTTREVLSEFYAGNLWISFRNGSADQLIDPILAADFPELGIDPDNPSNPSTFRQRSVATLVCKANYGDDFEEFQKLWGSIQRPNPLVILRGVPVYDPRDPMQWLPSDPRDPEEYAAARASWKHSRNASLIQGDYLWWEHGGRVPLSKIRWDEIAKSAEWDDSHFETGDGELIAKHTIDGVVTAGQVPLQILTTMLSANRGFVARRNGTVSIISSYPKKPVFTITDDMVLGGFDFRRGTPKAESVNKMRCRFIDPRQESQAVDGPILVNEDYIESDGDTYEGAVELPWTSDHRRAQRLQWGSMEDTRRGRLTNLLLDLRAFGLEAGMVVRRYSEILPRCNGIYQVQESGYNYTDKSIQVALAEYDETVDTGYLGSMEQPFELPTLDVS